MPVDQLGSFLTLVPPPLCLGTVELADGTWRKGFLCEPRAIVGATEITHHGGWRAYRRTQAAATRHLGLHRGVSRSARDRLVPCDGGVQRG